MKKLFYSVLGIISICLYGLTVFAEPASGSVTVGRVEAVDYIIMIGCGIFVVGMLFIILALRDSKKKPKKEKAYDEFDYDEDYDEYDDEYDNIVGEQDDFDDSDVSFDDEDEEIEDIEEVEQPDEVNEEGDTEIDEDESAEDMVEIVDSDEEPIVEPIEEPEDEAETEPEPEPEPEKPKVRITLTGINNPDVKIMEFTDKITLGRRAGNDIMLSDGAVSGKHCEISFENEVVYVTDLESTNGTYLNDEPVVRAEINSGDMLIIGKSRYKINITK